MVSSGEEKYLRKENYHFLLVVRGQKVFNNEVTHHY